MNEAKLKRKRDALIARADTLVKIANLNQSQRTEAIQLTADLRQVDADLDAAKRRKRIGPMTKLEKLTDKRADLVAEEAPLLEKNSLTTAERRTLDTLQEDIDLVDAEIAHHKRSEERQGTGERPGVGDQTHSTSTSRAVKQGNSCELRSHAQLGITTDNAGWDSFDQAVRAVMDGRHHPLLKRSVIEGVPSQGGFMIADTFAAPIFDGLVEESVTLSRVRTFPIASGSLSVPSFDGSDHSAGLLFGGVQANWISEEGTITQTDPKFRDMTLTPHGLKVLSVISNEALSNSSDLGQMVEQALISGLSWKLDEAIINGDGAGKPSGILNANATVTASKEGGQVADTFLYENALKMWARLKPGSHNNAIWMINPELIPQLGQMALNVGTAGAPAYLPANGAADTPFQTLFGRPVIPTEKCSAIGDLGDVILADLSWYALGVRKQITLDRSQHVYFSSDREALRAVMYVDGQPLLASPFTPFKGSATLSPFVILEAR